MISRGGVLIVLGLSFQSTMILSADSMPQTYNPVADPKAIVRSGNARFTVLSAGVIRMEYSPDGQFDDRASYVVVNRKLPVPEFESGLTDNVQLKDSDAKKALGITTSRIHLNFLDDAKAFNKANLILETLKPGRGWNEAWELVPPFKNKNNLGGTVRTLDGVNGSIPLPDGILSRDGWYCLDDSQSLMFDANSPAGEGAGRYKDDPWITPRNKPGYIDWYFFSYGHDYKQALKDYISVAGRIPVPPRFAFGTWWSRYWDYTDAELRQLVKEFKDHDVPLDVLVIDMGWHLDGWTGYTWNPKCFPDPEGFLKWVHEQGLKATLNLHPADGVGKHEKAFPEMCKAMGLDPAKTDVVPFDCTDRKYMDAYFKYLHHPLEAMGIDFWWMDWQQGKQTKMPGLDPLPWINYLHWHDMDKRAAETGKRPLLFSRWGGLGNHRYQIGFSGDTFSTWQSLAFQPYFTATAGNVGYAYWSHDIGGHMPGKVDPELYTRWIQWGALSPILRTHTTKNPEAERRIWAYPPEYFNAMKKAFELRYELIPYIYTASRQCYDTGLPICRPLYYEWPDLDESYKWKNEYLFGDQLLVAPVTEPADPISGCAMVEVWLPPGKWINWFSGRTYDGLATVPLVVPIDEIPVFVKDGGIVVTQKKTQRSDEQPLDPLIVNVFAGASGETFVYEDEGRSDVYAEGQFSRRKISHRQEGMKRTIEIQPRSGAFGAKSPLASIQIQVRDCLPAEKIVVNGKPLEGESHDVTYEYENEAFTLHIGVSRVLCAEPVRIEVQERADEKISAMISEGGRGKIRLYREFRKELANAGIELPAPLIESLASLEKEQSDPLLRTLFEMMGWGGWVQLIHERVSDKKLQTNLAVRMTGAWYSLRADVPNKNSRQALHLKVGSVFSAPLSVSVTSSQKDMIAIDPGFKSVESEPLVRRIELPNVRETSQIDLSLRLRWDDEFSFHVPLSKTLLPSINAWHILGPFENPFADLLKREFPPDRKVDLGAEYDGKGGKKIKWRRFERQIKPGDDLTSEFFVDFDDVFGDRVYDCVVYGFVYLDAPEDLDAVLALGTDDGCAVTLNGKEVHRIEVGRAYSSKADRVPVKLKKGQNTLLLKVFQGAGDGGWCVYVEDKDGKPLTQVKPHL